MIDPAKAREIAEDWIDGWNEHDLDRVMSHYADDVEFVSPLIVKRTGNPDGTLHGADALRAYFAQRLVPGSALHFELDDVLCGVSSVTLCYRNHRQQVVAETKVLDQGGRATRVYVHHRDE